jgi:hypothetical protein
LQCIPIQLEHLSNTALEALDNQVRASGRLHQDLRSYCPTLFLEADRAGSYGLRAERVNVLAGHVSPG